MRAQVRCQGDKSAFYMESSSTLDEAHLRMIFLSGKCRRPFWSLKGDAVAEESSVGDFGTFFQRSRAQLAQDFGDHDLRANDLIMVLNHAAGIATGWSEGQVFRPKGLSWNAFKVLFILWIMGDLEQHRVAQLAGTSRATTSAVVKNLVRDEYVAQVQSVTDKRTHVLVLTAGGREMVRQSYLEQNDLLHGWADRLTEAEQDILKILLLKLVTG